jgi:hypothetical protein
MNPMPVQALADLFGRQFDVGTEGFQHIGAAGFGRHAAIAVFGDLGTGRRRDEHRGCGNIEGVRAITAGTHDVDQTDARRGRHLDRELAHDLGRAGDLTDGFLLHAHAGQNGGNHHIGHFATHDLPHQRDHFVMENLAVVDDALQGFLRIHGRVSGACCCRKLRSMSWPCWVRMDSGWNCTPSTGRDR